MTHTPSSVAAQLVALVDLTTRMNAASAADRPFILADALGCDAGTLGGDGIVEIQLYGIFANGLDLDQAAESWCCAANRALSGMDPAWAEIIVLVPPMRMALGQIMTAAQTVLRMSSDPRIQGFAHRIEDAFDQLAFPEQRGAAA